MKSWKLIATLKKLLTWLVLSAFALIMIFPFVYMLTTSLKLPKDTFRYPPRLLPREPLSAETPLSPEPLPLYHVEFNGQEEQFVLVESNIRVATYRDPARPDFTLQAFQRDVEPRGGSADQETILFEGEQLPLWDVPHEGQIIPMIRIAQTAVGRFLDPDDPTREAFQNVRLSDPVERLTAWPQNYSEVVTLQGMDRSLSNTALVTILVVLGQITTSVLGGYAFARLRFPGRDALFVLYLGTIMIPFVVLITPLYQLMVAIGWVDRLAALVVPWIFTAYGTFLMRQFFITIPREIEEAALIDGASRLQILWRIFLPASTPAIATLATFTFLYAWNSFFWPLVVINTGNVDNHVLTLSLNVLRGRASDSPNLILAGAAIAVLPPMLIFIFGQRFFVESATASGVKG
jgi:multiple sugar transport system permease protein